MKNARFSTSSLRAAKQRSNPSIGCLDCVVVILLAMTGTSWAADQPDIQTFCQALPNHKPEAGVNYMPGVDVHGKPVAPADLGGGVPALPDIIRVPLTIDLAQRMNLGLPADTEMDADVTFIDIYRDGRVDYNGQEITPQAHTICELMNHEQAKQ